MNETIAAFGPLAQRIARGMTVHEPLIVADRSGIGAAAAEALRRRSRNASFFVRFLLHTEEALRLDTVAQPLVAPVRSLDDARELWSAACSGTLLVNQQPLHTLPIYTEIERRLISATLRLSNGYAGASDGELRNIAAIARTPLGDFVRSIGYDPVVPSPGAGAESSGEHIVIWAPDASGDAAQAFVLPLLDFKTPIVAISATDPQRPGIATFARAWQAAELLGRAKVIVDTSSYGPDTALALARWGRPLVADAQSGAHELIGGIHLYSRRNAFSLLDAVATALGASASSVSRLPDRPSAMPLIEPTPTGPLVTVIIPTLDRKELLRLSIESVLHQDYTNIQTIVVVDGGPRLDDLASEYPSVEFIHNAVNDRYERSRVSLAAAKGVYLNFLNDDDLFFPNHVGTLVAALERGRSPVAHADVITAYLRGDAQRGWELYGLDSTMSNAVDPTELLIANSIDLISCMFRRDIITEEATVDPTIPYFGDYPLWVKLSRSYDFVHVPKITACYTIRNGGIHQQSVAAADKRVGGFEALYRRDPVDNRPTLKRRREEYLNSLRSGEVGPILEPPSTVPTSSWPPWS